jgi:hypothetical protein
MLVVHNYSSVEINSTSLFLAVIFYPLVLYLKFEYISVICVIGYQSVTAHSRQTIFNEAYLISQFLFVIVHFDQPLGTLYSCCEFSVNC